MVITKYHEPKSSFLSIEKDMSIIVNEMLKSQRLKKLLYYPVADCLTQEDLTEKQSVDLIGKEIKMVPKLKIVPEQLLYLFIEFDNFLPNDENPEFRDNLISFDVLCHYDLWHLKDFELRPYRIAAELDTIFQNVRLTNIGKLNFYGASQIIYNDEFGGVSLIYKSIHGEEDKKIQPNPANEEKFLKEFNEQFNS